ncbi:MAG: VCBS repeat-containing protein, partial [Candidatus Latescibacterota bacterium]
MRPGSVCRGWTAVALCAVLGLPGGAGAQTLFTDVTDEVFATRPWPPRSAAFGDVDNDGQVDLFFAAGGNTPAPRVELHTREGGGEFLYARTALPLPAGMITWNTYPGGGSVLGDYDNDGDLDAYAPMGCYVSDFASTNLLLRNDQGVFTDVAAEAGLTDVLPTDNAVWWDYDRDGHLDLYTANLGDAACRNRLYRNQRDGTFADVTAQMGLDGPLHPALGGSNGGVAAADFTGDGWPDLYVGVYGASDRLFLSTPAGFWDATLVVGETEEAFGVGVGDYDNDGDLDI